MTWRRNAFLFNPPKPKKVRGGKRGHRALTRLRHAATSQCFIRWAYQTNNLPPASLEGRPWRTREWHQWHELGRP